MKRYDILVPIAGHAYVQVEAENEEQAKELALEEVTIKDIENWEPLEHFNRGNVCYCPSPWEIEITDIEDLDEEDSND